MNFSPENSRQKQVEQKPLPEAVEFVPKFEHIREDLLYLFNIQTTSEASLNYPWVKDELFLKVTEELKLGTPFALDYMLDENLLTREDLQSRNINALKDYARTILTTYKGPRLARAIDNFINAGMFTKDEVTLLLANSQN
jgi:hypothetical protein